MLTSSLVLLGVKADVRSISEKGRRPTSERLSSQDFLGIVEDGEMSEFQAER